MEENRDNIQNTTDEQQCAPETIQPMPQPQMQAPLNMAYMGVPPQYGAVYTPYGVPAAAAKPKKKPKA